MKIRDHKDRGEWAELRFMCRAAELGFKITRQWGGSSPYDFVVDLGGGRFVSVQVKSTTCLLKRKYKVQRDGCYGVTVRHQSRRPYGLTDFQYLAAYVIPKDIWYIIPFALVIGRKTVLLRPDDPPDNGFERYRETWHLLREVAEAIDPKNLPSRPARYNVPGLIRRTRRKIG
jgi:hypothetical protein